MAGVNKVILIGNLGADPEIRYTAGGSAVGNFRIATTESWNDREGQRQERTEWHRIVAWGKLAELCGEYLSKGRQVYIEGKIQTRQWDDRDGNKRYTTEIVAQNLTFLGNRGADDAGHSRSANPNPGPSPSPSPGPAPSPGPGPSAPASGQSDGDFDYGPPPMTDDDVPF